jgi:hypothetical protein
MLRVGREIWVWICESDFCSTLLFTLTQTSSSHSPLSVDPRVLIVGISSSSRFIKIIFQFRLDKFWILTSAITYIHTCPLSQRHVTIVEPLGIDLLTSTAAETFKPDEAPTKNPSSHKSLKTCLKSTSKIDVYYMLWLLIPY